MDEDLEADYPYVRFPLKGVKNKRGGETLMMDFCLIEYHSHGVDMNMKTHSFTVNDDFLREAIWDNDLVTTKNFVKLKRGKF